MTTQAQREVWADDGRTVAPTEAAGLEQHAAKGIRAACEGIESAWSRGDAAALGALLADDCDQMTLTRVRHARMGRSELVSSWLDALARRGPDFSVRMAMAVEAVRLLRQDLALVDGSLEFSDDAGPQHRSSQPFTAVMGQTGAQWKVLSLRLGPRYPAAKIVRLVGPAGTQ